MFLTDGNRTADSGTAICRVDLRDILSLCVNYDLYDPGLLNDRSHVSRLEKVLLVRSCERKLKMLTTSFWEQPAGISIESCYHVNQVVGGSIGSMCKLASI